MSDIVIADPLPLMRRYLGDGSLSNDEREILLFALYMESLQKDDGIASQAVRALKETYAHQSKLQDL